jgi:hypothetical protein
MNRPTSATTRGLGSRNIPTGLALSKALFFGAAALSFCLSIWLWFSGDRERGLFVGLWVPSILSAGGLLLTARHE